MVLLLQVRCGNGKVMSDQALLCNGEVWSRNVLCGHAMVMLCFVRSGNGEVMYGKALLCGAMVMCDIVQ